MTKKAIILLSGGLDSVTVLAMVKKQGYTIYALSFDYGQKHNAELKSARKIAQDYQVVEHKIINLGCYLCAGQKHRVFVICTGLGRSARCA